MNGNGYLMDTHSDDLYVPLLGAEIGTVRDGLARAASHIGLGTPEE